MELQVRFARQVIGKVDGKNHMVVKLIPPNTGRRQPVACVAVIDRSGSMDEYAGSVPLFLGRRRGDAATKLAYAKIALNRLIEHMGDGDYFGLVSFSDVARVEVPLTIIGSQSRQQISRDIDRIYAGGSTNIEDGMKTAMLELLTQRLANHNRKLVLLSDGEANVGETGEDALASLVHRWHKQGVTFTTLGVGAAFNSQLMDSIARSGGGDFHYVHNLQLLPEIMRNEFEASAFAFARNTELTVAVASMVALGKNLNDYPERHVPGGVQISLGDLTRAKSVVFEVSTPLAVHEVAFKVQAEFLAADDVPDRLSTDASLQVVDPDKVSSYPADPEVTELVFSLIAAQGVAQASQAYDQGNLHDSSLAMSSARQAFCMMADVYNEAESAVYLEEIDALANKMERGNLSAEESKAAYARSARVRSSRPRDNA